MKTYYEGKLVLSKNICLKKIKFSSNNYVDGLNDIKINFLNANYKLSIDENDILVDELYNSCDDEVTDAANEILSKVLMSKNPYSKVEITICYEKIYDNKGNSYAKELHTGFIFPILESADLNCDLDYTTYESKYDEKKVKGVLFTVL